MRNSKSVIVGLLALAAVAALSRRARAGEEDLWQHEVSVERPPRQGKPQPRGNALLWIPPQCAWVRGTLLAQMTLLEKRLTRDPLIRKAAADEGLAIVFLNPGYDALFDYVKNKSGEKLEKILAELAQKSGHPELMHAPWLTLGHSTGGIFARNIAYWKPDRVIAIIHIMSGNLHQHIPTDDATLAGVPFLAINGELEEHGPEGGIRPEYGRETQWIMIRKQMLDRRAEDPNHLFSLLVNPGGSHTAWSDALSDYCALFIRKAAKHRIPKEKGDGKSDVKCLPLTLEDGWLTDANLKHPQHRPAPYAQFTGDKLQAFWHLDEEMALATWRFHEGRFTGADPSLKSPPPSLGPPRGTRKPPPP